MENFSRRYPARFVMDAFARRTGFFGDQHQPVAVAIPKAEVRKCDREADLFAEGVNCSRFFRRGIGELKSRQDAKGHFFAMVKRMGFLQGGESVVNGMGACQSAAFKADAA